VTQGTLRKARANAIDSNVNGNNVVDANDLHELVNVKILDIQSPAPVVSAPRRQAPMSAPKAAIKPINFSVKKGVEDIKQQKLYRTK